jgi:electron transport complex protein RnfE
MPALVDAISMGTGFLLVLVTLGAARELIGQGTLFADLHLMFGEAARSVYFSLGDDFEGALIAILPPGAFIGLGLLIAVKNIIDQRAEKKKALNVSSETATAAS